MQNTHFQVIGNVKIGLILFQNFKNGNVTSICGIMDCSIALSIGLVKQKACLHFDFSNVFMLVLQIFSVILEVELENLRLIMVGSMMNHSIFMTVTYGQQI